MSVAVFVGGPLKGQQRSIPGPPAQLFRWPEPPTVTTVDRPGQPIEHLYRLEGRTVYGEAVYSYQGERT